MHKLPMQVQDRDQGGAVLMATGTPAAELRELNEEELVATAA